jgi:hypothetical protein
MTVRRSIVSTGFAMLAFATALGGCGSATKPAANGTGVAKASSATATSEGPVGATGGQAKLALCAQLRQAQTYFDKTADKAETSVGPTEIGNAAATLEREAKMLRALLRYRSAATRDPVKVIESGADFLRAAAHEDRPEFVARVKAAVDAIPGKEIAALCKA